MTDTVSPTHSFAPGALVRTRGREWVVLPESEPDLLIVRPLGGGDDDTAAVFPALEEVVEASFAPPTVDDLGDATSASMLRTALRLGFRSTAGPFRSLAGLAVEPRAYQYVPLMMALRQEPVRMLIADDVGIGKTIEAGLIVTELLAQGDASGLAVLCSPALAEQWQSELREKFAIEAELVLPSTVTKLTRGLMLNESLFDKYPFVVVSTDFIKSHTRRQEFLNHCPNLVVVDEAHGAVSESVAAGARTQRYELLKDVAADTSRHLVLVTATPHSGKEEGFRNLIGLLDPELATIDLETAAGRTKLARHFVQRRRADIRHYLDEETAFPSDRETKDAPYELTADYRALFDKVVDFAREQVADPDSPTGQVRQRVRWWSALALLRSLASSPPAAAATLRTRAKAADAASVAEVDAIGRETVLDTGVDEAIESADLVAGASEIADDDEGEDYLRQSRRLLGLAVQAEELAGPKGDAKLKALISEVKGLLQDGFDPIVFCRFIPTAGYVAEHLAAGLGKGVSVAAVTGELPPAERIARIDELTADPDRRHVLVATDCLSEGVNLQEHFQAVVHYDLAWNPTRHEQREGRVDRFGQRRDIVRATTLFGIDNQIDGIVLDVLIRKHREISRATGVAVPVPDRSDSVVEALMEGLILRGQRDPSQLTFDLGMQTQRDDLHREWESAAERERRSQTKYAQGAIHPDDVQREVSAARAALGRHADVEQFTRESLRALGASVTTDPKVDGFVTHTATLPIGLRDALPPGHREPLPFHRDFPVPRREALLARTDAHVAAVARFVLDATLDAQALGPGVHRPATRAGVMRTDAVSTRTTLLVVRLRFHLDLPGTTGVRTVVTEDAVTVAFEGAPANATWLADNATVQLLDAEPSANVPADTKAHALQRVLDGLDELSEHLDGMARTSADELLAAHRRVREGAQAAKRGLSVRAVTPVDVVGVYVLLPTGAAS
ncbi:helicase-related protein [Ilumatobacter nonamiensis]|uniref:helicase-related protein n=1 Tax=Ilumatobacter nonamiensis TaxID=467093 RepID=UPI0003476D35|nr:helicase-related protein [Ilumatobacter nonamiensis]